MSLPAAYSNILSELNRDVIRSQPSDVVQFCANWFNQRLEAERITLRSTQTALQPAGGPVDDSRMRDVTPPHSSTRSTSSSNAAGPSSNIHRGSFQQPTETQAGLFNEYASHFGGRPSIDARAMNSSAGSEDDDEEDEDVADDFGAPSAAGYNPTTPAVAAGGGLPVGYNMGRRTSVSAESLDPNAQTSSLPKTVIPKTASQRARIEKAIANNLLFRNLDEDQYNDVVNAMKEVTVSKGTEVIVQGAVGDFFYVVEEGTFDVWVRGPPTHTYAGPGQSHTTPGEEKKVASYGPGGSFGELALMYNAPRAATVVATSRATMWALDRVTFRSILMEHTSRKRKMYETFLSEVPILQTLNVKERAKIADALEEKIYDDGEAVVIEGEVGKAFYIIESGTAQVSRKKAGGYEEEILGTLGKGDYFGELALINSAPRAATVRAMPGTGRLRVATLGEKAFTRLLGPIIDILQRKAEHSYGPHVAHRSVAPTDSSSTPTATGTTTAGRLPGNGQPRPPPIGIAPSSTNIPGPQSQGRSVTVE